MSLFPQYARPRNVEQAAQVLAGLTGNAMVIAGGQELLPSMNYGRLELDVIVDINGLDEMRGISLEEDHLRIGALTVHRDVQSSTLVQEHAPMLAYSATQVGGGWQVQNRGTIGGNIVSMHPLYDILPVLLALGASVEICDASGPRQVRLEALIQDTGHGLGVGALLTQVLVPLSGTDSQWAYEKLKATSGAYGSANAATLVRLDSEGILADISMVIGGASDKPIILTEQLAALSGRRYTSSLADEIEQRACAAVTQPLSDHQGDGHYRTAMAGVMAKRAFASAAQDEGAE